MVPFVPNKPYWLIVRVNYECNGAAYLLFDPASISDEVEREKLAASLDVNTDLTVAYRNPNEVLAPLLDPKYADTAHTLDGEFAEMPPNGTPVIITRVLTGIDIDY